MGVIEQQHAAKNSDWMSAEVSFLFALLLFRGSIPEFVLNARRSRG